MSQNEQSRGDIQRITWIGLAVNLFLSLLKFTVGCIGKSQAVIADAVHSVSDMATDIAVLGGVKYWSAPADETHPFGHRRIEALVTASIGIVLLITALGIGYQALMSMQDGSIMQPAYIAVIGPFLSIIFKEILYHWTVSTGTRVKSSAVIANAWHHRSDAISSIPALIAVAAAAINPKWAFIDHVGALIVSIFIIKISSDIIYPAFSELSDCGASQIERAKIHSLALNVQGVHSVHAIRTRKFGSGFHVDLHILVDGDMTVRKGHTISEEVKSELLANGPEILDVVVHLEPDE
ncbi:MAG: cation diffusion facilitator family transporter [bacterium]